MAFRKIGLASFLTLALAAACSGEGGLEGASEPIAESSEAIFSAVFTAQSKIAVSATAVQVGGDPIMNGVIVLKFLRSQTATTASGTFPLSGPQGTIITPPSQFSEIVTKANALPTPFNVNIAYNQQFPNAVVTSISVGGPIIGLSSPAANVP